ncbi:hypothetical protein CVT25_007893 [Psilocybe cyanescens]|uniref:Uncharacterized protein n=1 Tax=Psilocybe cyanescens TaxID=93625 RepID=A0A409XTV9_PSICY|nr:hypothetical protein CVT25_007893 [Psilocybe cyanescens]
MLTLLIASLCAGLRCAHRTLGAWSVSVDGNLPVDSAMFLDMILRPFSTEGSVLPRVDIE